MTPIEFVLKWEGGLTNNAEDPGGITNFGISARAYPGIDIVNLTREDAIAIYERDYYQEIGAGLLPPAMALIATNAAVNCGTSRARKWLEASGGDYHEFLFLQLNHYASLKKSAFIQGWLNRTLDAWRTARTLEG